MRRTHDCKAGAVHRDHPDVTMATEPGRDSFLQEEAGRESAYQVYHSY